MKVVAKPIDCICKFDKLGNIVPIKIRTDIDGEDKVINIDKIISTEKERLAGNYMYLFVCQSLIGDTMKRYEIKYELATCKWMLWKI